MGRRPDGDLLLMARLRKRPRPATRPHAQPGQGPRTAPARDSQPRPRQRSAAGRGRAGGTITTKRFEITVDRDALTVKRSQQTAGGPVTRPHIDLPWPKVIRLEFATGYHDPVISLYAYTAEGRREHVMDSSHLTEADWARLSAMIADSTGRRVTLDLSGREAPGGIRPDA
jgi:hypothetical protein